MKRFREFLSEGSLDLTDVITGELKRLGIPHRIEKSSKHAHAVYTVNGKEHRFPFSHGKRSDGNLRHVMASAIRRHVRQASAQ